MLHILQQWYVCLFTFLKPQIGTYLPVLKLVYEKKVQLEGYPHDPNMSGWEGNGWIHGKLIFYERKYVFKSYIRRLVKCSFTCAILPENICTCTFLILYPKNLFLTSMRNLQSCDKSMVLIFHFVTSERFLLLSSYLLHIQATSSSVSANIEQVFWRGYLNFRIERFFFNSTILMRSYKR